MGYRVASISYNNTYKIIGKHPDGRIFAVKHDGSNGLFVVDRDLNLVSTLNTTLDNTDVTINGHGINECVVLKSGTMLCWGIYRTGSNQTKIYRSTDTAYSAFEEVFSLPTDITFIEKSVGVSTLDDTVMCCEYTMVSTDVETGLWLSPLQLNVWRGSNDGRDWSKVVVRNRNPQFTGDTDVIRHFHAVRYDPYENLFWIASGDWKSECAIYTINPDGTGLTIVAQDPSVYNGQRIRTTSFMFTEDYVWWGSDAQHYQDHPMGRLNRKTGQIESFILPDDCIRTSDKIATTTGDILLACKSYEKAPTNSGTVELFICDDLELGNWLSVYTWDVQSVDVGAIIYQFVDNKDDRVFAYIRKVKDADSVERNESTAIIDLTEISIQPQGRMVKVGAIAKFSAINQEDTDVSDTLTWTSNNEAVATIDSNGVVITLTAGVTMITCSDSYGVVAKTFLTVMSANATNISAIKIKTGGALIAVPTYNPYIATGDTRLRFGTPNGDNCLKLVDPDTLKGLPRIKVKIEESTKAVLLFE